MKRFCFDSSAIDKEHKALDKLLIRDRGPQAKELYVYELHKVFVFDKIYRLWREEGNLANTMLPTDMIQYHFCVVP